MKLIKKIAGIGLMAITLAGAIAISADEAMAQTITATNVLTIPTNAPGPFQALATILPLWDPSASNTFNSGELFFAATPLWKSQTASGSTPYLSTSGGYFFTKNFGAEAEVITFGDGTGKSFVDSCDVHFIARKDVGNVAGYLFGGGGRDLNTQRFLAELGGGLEYRYRTRISFFADTRYKTEFGNSAFDGFITRVGTKLTF